MKRLFFILISVFLFSGNAIATPEPSRIEVLAQQSLLLDIENIDNQSVIAVGERGHVLLSNNGVDWQQSEVPLSATLTKVFFLDQNLGWAVGHDATILHSQDGGKTWQIQQYQPEIERPLMDIIFRDNQNGIAIGAYGLFYRTKDGGKNWLPEFHDELLNEDDREYLNELKLEDEQSYNDEKSSILPHFNNVTRDGSTLYLVGEIGFMAKSTDFGQSWVMLDEVYSGSFFDLARTNQGNLLVAGLRGHIFRSTDDGLNWQAVELDSKALLNGIIQEQNTIYVFGNAGVLLTSTDDGKTFTTKVMPDGKNLIAGTVFQNKLVIASEVGIKVIENK